MMLSLITGLVFYARNVQKYIQMTFTREYGPVPAQSTVFGRIGFHP